VNDFTQLRAAHADHVADCIGDWCEHYGCVTVTALLAALAQAERATQEQATRLEEARAALEIAFTYGLPPHDVSGSAEWERARKMYLALARLAPPSPPLKNSARHRAVEP